MPTERKHPRDEPDEITIFSPVSVPSFSEREMRLFVASVMANVDSERLKNAAEPPIARDADPASPIESVKLTSVKAIKFKENLDETLDVLRSSFDGIMQKPMAGLDLDEIEVALEVSAEGKVGILGSGVGIAGKSSMTVRFKRRS